MPDAVTANIPENKLRIVGNKNYGESNGIIYAKRHYNDYYKQSVRIPDELKKANKRDKEMFGSRYIDIMQPVTLADGSVKVFTDDNKFISQDCRHLTMAGTKYYSRILDIKAILGQK